MQTKQIIEQISSLLLELNRAKSASPHDDLSGGLPNDEIMAIKTRLMACIDRFAPNKSAYFENAKNLKGWDGYVAVGLGGILSALKSDYESGYIYTFEELVHGELFDDFLDMADELFNKGYKDSAAVVAGSVLEEHIRKLATRNHLDVLDSKKCPKKFDVLIVELVKVQQISEPQRKILAAWYGQRNEAAHGNYINVIKSEVGRMIDGIRDFMIRFPA